MDLVEIGRQAWAVTWRHKALWVFGLFVASGGGGAGVKTGVPGTEAYAWLWALFTVAGVLGLAALWMHVVSEAALIDAARRVRAGEAPRAGEELRVGRAAFWRVLRVKLLGLGALVGLGAAIAAPAVLGALDVVPLVPAILLALTVALGAVPLMLTAYVVYVFALRFAVVDGANAWPSVRSAWGFLHGRVLEALKLLVLAFVGQVGGAMAAFTAAAPGIAVGLVLWLLTGSIWAGAVVGGLLVLPPVVAVAGAAGTFRSSVWTIGFLESREAARA